METRENHIEQCIKTKVASILKNTILSQTKNF